MCDHVNTNTNVYLVYGSSSRLQSVSLIINSETRIGSLLNLLKRERTGCKSTAVDNQCPLDHYIISNGRRLEATDFAEDGKIYHIVPRVLGGKGGFGSMLRAIGAQIEKTTSREACRDLSGRRMRDINNEKKLKEWLAKEAEREKERDERRAERLSRHLNPPQHKFEDSQYHEQNAKVQEDLQDALQSGLKRAHNKTKDNLECESSEAKCPKMNGSRKEWLGVEMDSDDSDLEADPGPDVSAGDTNAACSSSSEDTEQPSQSSVSVPENIKTEPAEERTENAEAITPGNVPKQTDTKVSSSLLSKLPPPQHSGEQREVKDDEVKEEISSIKEEVSTGPVDLNDFSDESSLCQLGLERLKAELMARGLKCGGTQEERAARLYSVKGLEPEDYPSSLLAKAKGKGKKSR